MTSSYPDDYDDIVNPSSGDPLVAPSHSAMHTKTNNAVEAIQHAIGLTPPKITLSATEPDDNPKAGDIWVDISDPSDPIIHLAKEE